MDIPWSDSRILDRATADPEGDRFFFFPAMNDAALTATELWGDYAMSASAHGSLLVVCWACVLAWRVVRAIATVSADV